LFGELAITALADRALTIFVDVAKKSNITLTNLEVEAEAEKAEDSPKLLGVNMKVNASGKARKQLLQAVWRRTEANCPVVTMFKEPVPVNVELELKSEQ